MRTIRALLIGNYGVGNVGDEALHEYFLRRFSDLPDGRTVQWTVVSAYPQQGEMPRLPTGLHSLLGTSWWKTVGAMWRSDVVVFGGGSLFTDAESWFACVLWGVHAAAAVTLGCPVFLAFQGIGPFRTRISEGITQWVCRRARFVSVRDVASEERLFRWKLNTKIIQTFDPILSQISNINGDRIQKKIILIPRHNSGSKFSDFARDLTIKHEKFSVAIVSMQPDDPREVETCNVLSTMFHASVTPVTTLKELEQEIKSVSIVGTERYHGAIAALAMQREVYICSQQAGDKLDHLASLLSSKDVSIVRTELLAQVQVGEKALQEALQSL